MLNGFNPDRDIVHDDREDVLGDGGVLPVSDSPEDLRFRSNVPPNNCRSGLAARSARRPNELCRLRLGLDLGELVLGEEPEELLRSMSMGSEHKGTSELFWVELAEIVAGGIHSIISKLVSLSSDSLWPSSKARSLRLNDGERCLGVSLGEVDVGSVTGVGGVGGTEGGVGGTEGGVGTEGTEGAAATG